MFFPTLILSSWKVTVSLAESNNDQLLGLLRMHRLGKMEKEKPGGNWLIRLYME